MNSVIPGSIKISACILFACLFAIPSFAHNRNNGGSKIVVNEDLHITEVDMENAVPGFAWSAERKLTWNDFKGQVDPLEDRIAALICHGLGFEVDSSTKGGISVRVYNSFFPSRSWVRPGNLNSSVLAHEQCHFDICELYTRILRRKLNKALIDKGVMPSILQDIYYAVQTEYAAFQELYEQETAHGTIEGAQRLWEYKIAEELNKTELAKL